MINVIFNDENTQVKIRARRQEEEKRVRKF